MPGLRDSKMSGRRPIQGFVRLAGLLLLAHAGVAAAQEITDCDAHDGLEPLCGVRGSEDLEVLPGGGQLIVSESRVQFDAEGRMHWLPSGLARLDLGTRQPQPLYPAPGSAHPVDHWGDADCKGEIGAALSPHGMQLSRRADGRWQLLVVNHGGRESVEIFELLGRGARASLAWRGCVLAPPHAFLNDVAALAAGGFVVTQYMDPRRTMAEQHADAEVDIYYIDIRAHDKLEAFYSRLRADPQVRFVKSKPGHIEIGEDGRPVVCGELTTDRKIYREPYDLVVLATGMEPSAVEGYQPRIGLMADEYGFLVPREGGDGDGIFSCGVAAGPLDVSLSVQSATAAALKAVQALRAV